MGSRNERGLFESVDWLGIRLGRWAPRQIGSVPFRLPVLDHQDEFFQQGIDFFKIFSATFFGFEVQSATESNHISQIADFSRPARSAFLACSSTASLMWANCLSTRVA